eukprot:8132812-Pyramimonas_sp.AAC.1
MVTRRCSSSSVGLKPLRSSGASTHPDGGGASPLAPSGPAPMWLASCSSAASFCSIVALMLPRFLPPPLAPAAGA